jgi:hypothetical protein
VPQRPKSVAVPPRNPSKLPAALTTVADLHQATLDKLGVTTELGREAVQTLQRLLKSEDDKEARLAAEYLVGLFGAVPSKSSTPQGQPAVAIQINTEPWTREGAPHPVVVEGKAVTDP